MSGEEKISSISISWTFSVQLLKFNTVFSPLTAEDLELA